MTKQRFNLALPERSMQRLDGLKARTDAASIGEVIKNALMTYESIVDHLSKGATFFIRLPNGELRGVEFMIDVAKPALTLVSDNSSDKPFEKSPE